MAPKRKRAAPGDAPPARGLRQHNQCTQPCTISGSLPNEPLDLKEEYKIYVQDLCLCPSVIGPFEALPLEALGKFRGCSFAALNDAASLPCCPCVVCVERQGAGRRRDGQLIYSQEPLVAIDADCLCHAEPVHAGHALVSNAEVQTESVELISVAVQVEEQELSVQVSEGEEGRNGRRGAEAFDSSSLCLLSLLILERKCFIFTLATSASAG